MDDVSLPGVLRNPLECWNSVHQSRPGHVILHPALSSQDPGNLEKYGDNSSTLFDRWFCYQEAFHIASNLKSSLTDSILKKLSMLEADPDFPEDSFESVVTRYKNAVTFCQSFSIIEGVEAEQLTAQLQELDHARQTLDVYDQPIAFIRDLEDHFQHLLCWFVAQRPALRLHYPHVLPNIPGFLTDRLCLNCEGMRQEYHALAKSRISIGRSDRPGKESDIFVMDAPKSLRRTYISRFHAIIEYTPFGFQIIPDKNRYDIWLERGEQTVDVIAPTLLHHQDAILLGSRKREQYAILRYTTYTEESSAAFPVAIHTNRTLDEHRPSSSLSAAKISVELGIPRHRTFILCVSSFTIGRDASAPLHIPDSRISRTHAQITYQDGGFWISDAGSTNGTSLQDDCPCNIPTPLVKGDTIYLGQGFDVFVK